MLAACATRGQDAGREIDADLSILAADAAIHDKLAARRGRHQYGRDGKLAGGDGMAAAVRCRIEVGFLEGNIELDAPPRVGQAGSHFDGLPRFAASRQKDGEGVSGGCEFMKVSRAPSSVRVAAVNG